MTDDWAERKHLNYYRVVRELAKKYAPGAREMLDVGGYQPRYMTEFEWIPTRMCINVDPHAADDLAMSSGDFLTYKLGRTTDLVLCLQVLEHIIAPSLFARRLCEGAAVTIISVAYKWAAGPESGHFHDSIDEEKLDAWTARTPRERVVVKDEAERLVAVYVRSDG